MFQDYVLLQVEDRSYTKLNERERQLMDQFNTHMRIKSGKTLGQFFDSEFVSARHAGIMQGWMIDDPRYPEIRSKGFSQFTELVQNIAKPFGISLLQLTVIEPFRRNSSPGRILFPPGYTPQPHMR